MQTQDGLLIKVASGAKPSSRPRPRQLKMPKRKLRQKRLMLKRLMIKRKLLRKLLRKKKRRL
jgi:hypothetical protein